MATQIDGGRQIKSGTITLDRLVEGVIQADGGQAFTADQSLGGFKLTNLAVPTADGDAARLLDVNLAKEGIARKGTVKVASVGNLVLSATQTVDGVALSVDDRVLAKNQTDPAENGLYLVKAGPWVRTDDASTVAEVGAGARVFVDQGSTQANRYYTQQATVAAFADQVWVYDGHIADIVAGAGLTRTGDTIDVAAGSGISVAGDVVATTDSPLLQGQNSAYHLARANHSGSQLAATISDLTEATQDAVGAALADTATLDLVYDDAGNAITGNVLDSPTVGGATAAQVRDRSTHTGTQTAATISDLVEAAQDIIGAMLTGNTETGIAVTYDDSDGTIDFVVSGQTTRYVRETPSGAVNGANTTFVLANDMTAGSEEVFLNGILQEPGAGNDYTIAEAANVWTITYLAAPLTGDKLRVSYMGV